MQITKRGKTICEVRVREAQGKIKTKELTNKSLLEFYFIDVTKGDDVLICTPDRRHILIDVGLEKTK